MCSGMFRGWKLFSFHRSHEDQAVHSAGTDRPPPDDDSESADPYENLSEVAAPMPVENRDDTQHLYRHHSLEEVIRSHSHEQRHRGT